MYTKAGVDNSTNVPFRPSISDISVVMVSFQNRTFLQNLFTPRERVIS